MLAFEFGSLATPSSRLILFIFKFKYLAAKSKKFFLNIIDADLIAVPEFGTDKLLAVIPSFGVISVFSLLTKIELISIPNSLEQIRAKVVLMCCPISTLPDEIFILLGISNDNQSETLL